MVAAAYHQVDGAPKVYGGALEFWRYKGKEIILSGPYETGKTYATLLKLHSLLTKYPRSQGLMVRSTFKSIISSAVVTYEQKILPIDPDSTDSPIHKYGGERPDFYDYPNGSRLWVGGLDYASKFLSAEFDFIYVNQAEEIDLAVWETLVGRASGRAGNAPYTQIMADCNPSYPWHWILHRDTLKVIEQRHEHNPVLFNQDTGEMTVQGRESLATLDSLTGLRYQRGRLGLWVAAEGVVFDNFTLSGNVTADAEYNPERDVYWGVDDGYAHGEGIGTAGFHPRVILLGHQMPNGGLDIFDEYYQTLKLEEQSIAEVLSWPYSRPLMAVVDSSAPQLRRRLSEENILNAGGTHKIHEGIKVLRRFVCDGNDVRLLRIHPRCKNLIRELQTYRYDEASRMVEAGERKPLKLDDHAVDALRMLAYNFR